MRTRLFVLLLGSLAAGLLSTSPALAAGDDHDESPSSTSTIPEDGIGLDQGIFVSGAVVTPLDGGEERTMTDYEAAVFMQSWIGAGYYGGEDSIKDPPTDTPVYRIDFSGTWVGQTGNVSAYYTTDGETPFVSFPGFAVWTDPAEIPAPTEWFTPPARVIDAFNGDAELVETGGLGLATSVPTTPEEAASGSDSDSDIPWTWVVAGAGLAVVLIGGLTLRGRRRAGSADEPTT